MKVAARTARLFGTPSRALRAQHISGYSITCDLSDGVGSSLYYTGSYEPRLTELVSKNLRPGEVMVDVGANAGHFTFLAAALVGVSGHVHAIEASPTTAQQLQDDIDRNGLGDIVTLHRIGAGDGPGRLRVVESPDNHPIASRWLDPQSDGAVDGVQVMALDDVIKDLPHVVKVDVEGADLRALTGMRRLITQGRPRLILAEAIDEQLSRFGDSTEDLMQYMHEIGYFGELIDDAFYATVYAFWPRESI